MFIRSYFLSVWKFFDPLYFFITRLENVKCRYKKDIVFRVRLMKYRGKSVMLSDGTLVETNDIFLKIHLYNVALLKDVALVKNPLKRGRIVYKKVKNSMPLLVQYIDSLPKRKNIKGIIGITMINKGVNQLGFEQFPIENKFYILFKKIGQLPIYFLSSSSIHPRNIINLKPSYLIMSKEKLYKMYKNHN
ncbi:YkoP family protein [Metabacillus fastidiosus]|uniref:YkoP-like domain-containing protein n=1 Tax=Metabacillus fastidiosus TaxID=1458 RepID=A0ABU6P225_9BACI|nr:hypothetical protein [Metabacillus fastidiosus]MED4455293.1 hypothetical protein [Metabacillus fastidiosus]